MTPAQLLVCAVVLVTGLGTALATGPLLRWLPEPADPDPPGYARLPTPRFVLGVGLTSGLAAAVAWTALPLPVQPLWTVLATGGVLLAAVDLATTWLPLRLVHITWAAMAVAALAGASLGGKLGAAGPQRRRGGRRGRAVPGGVDGLPRGVRLRGRPVRPAARAAAAAVGWPLLLLALLAGTLVGGVVGCSGWCDGGAAASPTRPRCWWGPTWRRSPGGRAEASGGHRRRGRQHVEQGAAVGVRRRRLRVGVVGAAGTADGDDVALRRGVQGEEPRAERARGAAPRAAARPPRPPPPSRAPTPSCR